MIIPVRCFSCGTVIANRWDAYVALLDEGLEPQQALDHESVDLQRYCCRRIFVSHVDLLDEISSYTTSLG